MEKKKIIGAIIGITLFAALIAGATYAWLTATVQVNNGVYNAQTGNFVIDYNGGGQITNIPIVSTATPAALTESKKEITAKLETGSIPGKLTIKLTTTVNNLLTQSEALNYAVCVSTDCTTDFSGALATGTINTTTGGETDDEGNYTHETILYADTTDLTTTAKSYYVYFWLNGNKITNAMLEENNNQYSGYIHASAEQSH